ncbi:MAG: tetratricopeptide repeat protein [Bacteroidales bacterium]|nr:tetratricopeptide repeat protein [Bacteroidales bacterium]MCF8458243.1 tetratricopeptide repeat protein [Bacteroidales bacterium]
MAIKIDKPTRALIITMIALVVVVLIISKYYYGRENKAIDPRTVEANLLYGSYNQFTLDNQYDSIFALLDKVEGIYSVIHHYRNSYEMGVLYNNRAAAWLTFALAKMEDSTSISSEYFNLPIDSLLILSKKAVDRSISIYENWLADFGDLDEAKIREKIPDNFLIGLQKYSSEEQQNFLQKRIEDIQTAQLETPRRLSVSYTNLGIVYRHLEDYENAIKCYKKAVDYWDKNMTAENNLNILLGKPLKKRNFIQRLFPAERKKD